MNDFDEISIKLIDELLKNLVFFIPFELIDNPIFNEIIEITNFSIDDKLVDEYIDRFLFFDESFDIRRVESFETVEINLGNKIIELQKNCFKIAQLKDNLGIESFNYFYQKYIKQLNSYLYGSELMITNYDELYPESPKIGKNMIVMQEAVLQSHLIEVEETIGIKSTRIDSDELLKNIISSELFNQFKKKKEIQITPFRGFLKHDNKVEIEKIIKLHYPDLRGKPLRYLLEFLKEKNILILNYGDATKIFRSIKILFNTNDIGAYNSIFGAKVFNKSDVNYENAKLNFEQTLNIS